MTESVKLKCPVTQDGVTYEELSIRELTVAEMIAFNKAHGNKDSGFERDSYYFALVCGVPREVLLQMKQRDWNSLLAEHQRFLYGDSIPEFLTP